MAGKKYIEYIVGNRSQETLRVKGRIVREGDLISTEEDITITLTSVQSVNNSSRLKTGQNVHHSELLTEVRKYHDALLRGALGLVETAFNPQVYCKQNASNK